jgi:hypothetical protein
MKTDFNVDGKVRKHINFIIHELFIEQSMDDENEIILITLLQFLSCTAESLSLREIFDGLNTILQSVNLNQLPWNALLFQLKKEIVSNANNQLLDNHDGYDADFKTSIALAANDKFTVEVNKIKRAALLKKCIAVVKNYLPSLQRTHSAYNNFVVSNEHDQTDDEPLSVKYISFDLSNYLRIRNYSSILRHLTGWHEILDKLVLKDFLIIGSLVSIVRRLS